MRFDSRWLLAFMIVNHLFVPRLLQMPTWMLLLVGDKLGLGRQGSSTNSPPFKHIQLSKDFQPPLGACCWSWNDCCRDPQNVNWSLKCNLFVALWHPQDVKALCGKMLWTFRSGVCRCSFWTACGDIKRENDGLWGTPLGYLWVLG